MFDKLLESFHRVIGTFLLWMSKLILRGSGDVELMYDKIAEIGFIWERLVKLLPTLGIDDIVLVLSKKS